MKWFGVVGVGLFSVCVLASSRVASGRELSLPQLEITDQERTNYCALYAMSSFIEMVGRVTKPTAPHLAIDPAFLATNFNYEIGSGNGGAYTADTMYLVQKYGTIPAGAKITSDKENRWPMADWRGAHDGLMPIDYAKSTSTATYEHPSLKESFTGTSYLKDYIGLDFKDWTLLYSDSKEQCEKSATTTKVLYRGEDAASTAKTVNHERDRLGLKVDTGTENASLLYSLLTAHLYRKLPALLSLRTGLVSGYFQQKKVIHTDDLVAVDKGRCGSHIGVAMGHCHKKAKPSALCEPFQKGLEAMEPGAECIVFQNSWGKNSGDKGYSCLSRGALIRLISGIVISKELY